MNNLKILVIEDAPIIMRFNQVVIEKLGYQADYARTAEDALELCQAKQYDLILTDIGLPQMDGITMASKIRKHEKRYCFKEAKIYAMTAYDLENIRKGCLSSGINEVFNKPISPCFLSQIIFDCEKALVHH